MPLLQGVELERVVSLLEKRGVSFYHACQLKDFQTYVRIGGIPSRNLMESREMAYTDFETDAVDKDHYVWSKVFGNLSDFGYGFARSKWSDGTAPMPNPYGPILLVARPSILLKCTDVAICLRSAGGRNFDREVESLSSVLEVDQLFVYKLEEVPSPKHSWVKYSSTLRKEFRDRYLNLGLDDSSSTYNPEISCTIMQEYLPFDDLECIVTDKYWVNGYHLLRVVRDIAVNAGLRLELSERSYLNGRHEILASLVQLFADGPRTLSELTEMNNASSSMIDWVRRLISGNLEWQFRRFATYLENGTVSEMRKLP